MCISLLYMFNTMIIFFDGSPGGDPHLNFIDGLLGKPKYRFNNFMTAQYNITPKTGRITCTDQEKTRIPARKTATEHRLEPPPKQHTRRIHRNHCTFTPPRVATPLCCHPPSEGQANREGTKGGGRGADQGSPKTTISPSMLMEPPLKAHPGS